MTKLNPSSDPESTGWLCDEVWSHTESYEDNQVRQLLIPASAFVTLSGTVEALQVCNAFGTWPAAPADAPLDAEQLWAMLPEGAQPGDQLLSASWNVPAMLARTSPVDVLATYRGAIGFNEGTESNPGLRTPQLGAVHAVLGYWTTNRKTPATVVMPTGTGKTETMLALLVAARPPRLLVLVPSDALREQVATKFETLGVLQELGIVTATALRPVVGRVQHGFAAANTATAFAGHCNVIVATTASLTACDPAALSALLSSCSHLFIDEAHHVAARTWSAVREAFADKDVVQFTATPFREDGKHLQGRVIYSFPLREAQAQGYFSQIEYTSVIDFDDVDKQLAAQSVAKLRDDLAQGFDHVLMVRVDGIPRAKKVLPYYEDIAPDLKPAIINSRMAKGKQREALKALRQRDSRVIVCVNMLGEGFDLPALKVAAVHDPQKSLGVTLQFVGRFARTSTSGAYGDASVFVARNDIEVDRKLRTLYAEDSDWNLILRDLTEAAVQGQQEVSDFEEGFTSQPEEIALRTLLPKMSTVVYQAHSQHWDPQNIVEYFGEENLFSLPIGINADAGVAWCVVERRAQVRWGDLKTIEEVGYELYVLYFDSENKLLYINNSANDGVFEDLAVSVVGSGAVRFTGSTVYRVMAEVDRLVPTNVGVLDAHDQFRRFSMHVGSDVTASFSQAEAGTKTQTNISGGGYHEGEYVSISASIKGRIWSHSTASSLKQWCDWCDQIGAKLLDDSISIDSVIGQFILPLRLTERPEGILLAVEWPWKIHTFQADNFRLSYQDSVHEGTFVDLVPDTRSRSGSLRFEIKSGSWAVSYEAAIEDGQMVYRPVSGDDVKVVRPRSEQPLSQWLRDNSLVFTLDDDRIIEDNLLYRPTWDRDPYERSQLTALDWTGTTLTVESQTKERLPESIQYRVIEDLKAQEPGWDLIIDDDGAGEIADVVAIRLEDNELVVRLVHCKYSHGATAGARVADLYEVCGQAQKSIMWRRSDMRPFFKTLVDRATKKQKREGISPFEVGDPRKLFEIRDRSVAMKRRIEIVIVQPGLSVANATTQQLDLLASTQAYLRTTIRAPLSVWCSS